MFFFTKNLLAWIILFITIIPLSHAATKWDNTDVVANIHVLATTFVNSYESSNKVFHVYHSWLRMNEIQKGHASTTILVEWSTKDNSVHFIPGDKFKVFLTWDSKHLLYRATWIGSRKQIEKNSSVILPIKTGDVITEDLITGYHN